MESVPQAIETFNRHAQEVKNQRETNAHAESALRLSEELKALREVDRRKISTKEFTPCYQKVADEANHASLGEQRDGMIANMAEVLYHVENDAFDQCCDDLETNMTKMDPGKPEHVRALSAYARTLLEYVDPPQANDFAYIEREGQRTPSGTPGLEDLHHSMAALLVGLPAEHITEERIQRGKEQAKSSAEKSDSIKSILTNAEFLVGKLQKKCLVNGKESWQTSAYEPGVYNARFLRVQQASDEEIGIPYEEFAVLEADYGNLRTMLIRTIDKRAAGRVSCAGWNFGEIASNSLETC